MGALRGLTFYYRVRPNGRPARVIRAEWVRWMGERRMETSASLHFARSALECGASRTAFGQVGESVPVVPSDAGTRRTPKLTRQGREILPGFRADIRRVSRWMGPPPSNCELSGGLPFPLSRCRGPLSPVLGLPNIPQIISIIDITNNASI